MYGPPVPSQRKYFWEALDNIALAFSGPWLLLGDFNTIISQSDKHGGKPVASSSSGGLNGLIQQHGLIDMGFHGHPYTWSNGRSGAANIQARLDRGLMTGSWQLLFPDAHLFHLPSLQSDHKPLLLSLHKKDVFRSRPFRFKGMWTLKKSSFDVIRKVWHSRVPGSPLDQVVTCPRHTEVAMKKWNIKVFGRIQVNIQDLRSQIAMLQDTYPSEFMLTKERDL